MDIAKVHTLNFLVDHVTQIYRRGLNGAHDEVLYDLPDLCLGYYNSTIFSRVASLCFTSHKSGLDLVFTEWTEAHFMVHTTYGIIRKASLNAMDWRGSGIEVGREGRSGGPRPSRRNFIDLLMFICSL